MKYFKVISAAMVVTGLSIVLTIQIRTTARLRRDNEAMQTQFDQLRQARTTTDSQGDASNELNPEQKEELLKLRGEVTQLRGETNELAELRRRNEALAESLRQKVPAMTNQSVERPRKKPEDALPQDIHPKNSWGFRGYDSPDATIESMLWATTQGDKAAFMAGFSPEIQAKIEQEMENGKSFEEQIKDVGFDEFRILDRQTVSDGEVIVTVYTSQNQNGNEVPHSEDTHFKNIGGQWKVYEPQ